MLQNQASSFVAVPIDSLHAGMLVERDLYIELARNERLVCLVKALQPLEERTLRKLRKVPNVYSSEASAAERFPTLEGSVARVREMCIESSMAPFERNRAIRAATRWLIPAVFGTQSQGDVAAIFFFHRLVGAPASDTLQFLADHSVGAYLVSLRIAAYAGIIALWLGYSDFGFLREFAESAFCAEIDAHLAASPGEAVPTPLQLIRDKRIPGVGLQPLARFHALLARASGSGLGNEAQEIIALARWAALNGKLPLAQAPSSRAHRKLELLLGPAIRAEGETKAA